MRGQKSELHILIAENHLPFTDKVMVDPEQKCSQELHLLAVDVEMFVYRPS